jgi:hypothetical protein
MYAVLVWFVQCTAPAPMHNAHQSYTPTDIAPQDPESCVIGEIIRAHLHEFLEQATNDSDGQTIPAFVQRELRALSQRSVVQRRAPD